MYDILKELVKYIIVCLVHAFSGLQYLHVLSLPDSLEYN